MSVAGIVDEYLIRGDPLREMQRQQRITRIKFRRVGSKSGESNGRHGRACGLQVSVDDSNDSAGASKGVRNEPPDAGSGSTYEGYF